MKYYSGVTGEECWQLTLLDLRKMLLELLESYWPMGDQEQYNKVIDATLTKYDLPLVDDTENKVTQRV